MGVVAPGEKKRKKEKSYIKLIIGRQYVGLARWIK